MCQLKAMLMQSLLRLFDALVSFSVPVRRRSARTSVVTFALASSGRNIGLWVATRMGRWCWWFIAMVTTAVVRRGRGRVRSRLPGYRLSERAGIVNVSREEGNEG